MGWAKRQATERSIARRTASASYIRTSSVDVDARGVLDWMDRLKMNYLGKSGVRRIVREEMATARKSVQEAAKRSMKSDPRRASLAVSARVYKGGGKGNEGGNLNIMRPKGSVRRIDWETRRKRGKIKRKRERSEETNRIDGYWGKSRFFVLHWIDAGTPHRPKRSKIAANNFFTRSARQALTIASVNVKQKVGQLVKRTR